MKKVLLSLLMAVVCLPIAFGQAADRPFVTTSQISCGPYTWPINSETYSSDTTVLVISDTAIYVLDLTVRTASGDTTQVVDSANCVYFWNDSIWKTSGEHIGIIQGQNGACDSIVRVMLTLTGVDSSHVDTTVCDQFRAPWGEILTESVAFDSTYTTTEGCQRHDVVNIKIGHSFSTYEEYDADGCSYRWNGYTINVDTVKTYKFKTKVGKCDSIYRVKVNLSFRVLNEFNVTNCGPYTFHGVSRTATGTYIERDTTMNGRCVTTDSLNLIVNPVYYNANPAVRDVEAGCYYKWAENTFTDLNVVHTDTVLTVDGCDSIGSIRIIAYSHVEYDTIDTAYCGTTYIWANRQVTTAGIYDTSIVTTVNNAACTTNYHLTLAFTVNNDTVSPVTRCATYTFDFHGQRNGQGFGANDKATFTESGVYVTDTTYTDTLFPDHNLYIKNPNTGCITLLTLPLTIVEPEQRPRNGVTNVTACDKYTFKVGNATSPEFTTDTVYELVYENHSTLYSDPNRCYDSIGVLNLTIKHSTNIDTVVSACDSFYWAFADTTLFHTEDFRKVTTDTNEEGCPFYGHLRLTVHYTPNVAILGDWMLKPGESTVLRASTTTPNVKFQWYKDNTDAGTDSTITVTDAGDGHNVNVHLVSKVNNQNCPADNWLTVTFTNVGIDETESVGVDIYPNPANRIVNISCGETISQVVVYNAIGQQVLVSNNSGNTVQLDLGSLAGGAYTMRVITADGNHATRKLIVSK